MSDYRIEKKNNQAEKPKKNGGQIALRVFKIILLIILLPVILLYLLIRGIVKLVKKRKWEREGKRGKLLLLSSTITDIDIMEGYAFEEYAKTLLFYDGYETEKTQSARDYGADLILEKDGVKIAVQCKRYNKMVGVKCVQEVIAAKQHYKCDDAWVITNAHFTEPCETLAKENGVRLIDREELIEIYTRVQGSLKISVKESELVDKEDKEIEDKFPFMI